MSKDLRERLTAMAETIERSDAHGHMDVSMVFTYAADLLREAAAALAVSSSTEQTCLTCGSTQIAENGWCITCKYGDKPYH